MSTSEFRLSKHGSPLKWWSGLQIQYKPPGFLSKRPIPTRLTQFPPSSNLLSKLNPNTVVWAGVRCCNSANMTFQKAWLPFTILTSSDLTLQSAHRCRWGLHQDFLSFSVFSSLSAQATSSMASTSNQQVGPIWIIFNIFVPKQWASRNAHCCWDQS